MAGESKKEENPVAEVSGGGVVEEKKEKKKKRGLFSRIWNGLFRLHGGDDFEKRLQHISKEEAIVLARLKKRSSTRGRMARNLIIFSVLFEVIAVGYAIMTTRSLDMDWKMRALRVLPMFLLPVLSSVMYSALISFTRMCDRKDQKTLDRLRAERQAKIDELKERTNYYITQQLIQRYDPDPAAKAAAATVLASKLGADSGLKVFVGDESKPNPLPTGQSHDIELTQSTGGLRRRNQSDNRSTDHPEEMLQYGGSDGSENSKHSQLVVEHQNPTGPNAQDGGWIARIAALLVGEDPTQSYALICGNCHMHNGLARKEDFPFITYYCPHCNALNRPKQMDERSTGASSPAMPPSTVVVREANLVNNASGTTSEKVSGTSSPLVAVSEDKDKDKGTSEKIVTEDTAS